MASPSSPLYAFDDQLWEQLSSFLPRQDFCQLVLTGDKRTLAKCIAATRSLTISCKTVECFILSRALMNSNLKSLMVTPEGNKVVYRGGSKLGSVRVVPADSTTAGKNYPHVLKMISASCLTQLIFIGRNNPHIQLTLPSTLQKLVIRSIYDQSFKSFSLGGAKLVHLHLEQSRWSRVSEVYCKLLADQLIVPSVATLEHLTFRLPEPVHLDLSGHLLLTCVSVNINCLFMPTPFIPPPAAKKLVLVGVFTDNTIDIQRPLSTFGSTLVDITLEMQVVGLEILDISSLGHIESLNMSTCAIPLVCAPNRLLCITCSRQSFHVKNKGPGTLRIQTTCLVLRGGSLPPKFVLDSLDWPLINHIELDYSEDHILHPNVDYGPLRQAINITSMAIVSGDTLVSFAARDGPRFLQMFPKLAKLEWEMNMSLCASLTSSGFVLPASVQNLSIYTFDHGVASERQLLHLLDWLKHIPQRLELNSFPFIPRLISLCNDATTPFRLIYCSNDDMNSAIWTGDGVPIFLPSPHVTKASFVLYHCSGDTETQVLQKVFGPLYDDPDSDGEILISYRTTSNRDKINAPICRVSRLEKI